ncbi:MAG: AAA family ATPase, partial [Rhodobacteraceae bacterium]|nr:AAA family ATPase [Paracoccaceae bacterium]
IARMGKPASLASPLNGFAIATRYTPETGKADEPKPSGPLEWFEDIEASLTDAYMVKGVLASDTMSVIYGPSNSGKTFFALDLAFHISTGREWRGLRVNAAGVLYLAAEGGRGVLNRVVALKKETGITAAPIAVRRAGMDLLHNEADLQSVYNLAQEVKDRAPDMPLLIVIDTLSRIMAGGDENSAADMTALIRNIDAIRTATGAHVMLVHHTGKDTARGARGHSSLRAATDTEIEVQNEDGERAAQVQKQRDYQGGETFAFTLKSVSLGHDQDGDEVTSCVVEATDSEEFKAMKAAKKGVGGNQKIIMDTFDQMLGEGLGKPNPGGVGFPETGQFWTVKMDELRDYCMGKFDSANKRDAWRTAWRGVTEQKGLFCTASGLCWRIDKRVKR